LLYDSHEYFTEVPELIGRPIVRSIWTWIEKHLVPKVSAAYTVCDSIAKAYHDLYSVDFKVVRNLPVCTEFKKMEHQEKSLYQPKIILYQGALNVGRGIEAAIRAMNYIDGAELWLAGDGDITSQLKQLVEELKLDTKVKFLGRLPIGKLGEITCQADLGISLEEDLGLNYRFALPNKLFDYIQAGVPVLVSNLPEMRRIVEHYQIGAFTETHQRKDLAEKIKLMLFDQGKRRVWKQNLHFAATDLCWEKEEKVLCEIYNRFLPK
jgi:glycosyltransferase involved in cell wall biosynthesis